ncbi:MAG TPA: hypothetical protein VEW93_00240 [Acidimicrobiales bacterium]|nr:hypothetical protein [Acidimicrobiales bacterium]
MAHPQEDDPQDPFRLGDDPGWRPGSRDGRPDGLVALRFVFLSIAWGLVLVGVVVGLLVAGSEPAVEDLSPWAMAAAVAAVGAAGLLLVRFGPVRLDCADELALARSWRSRFFARTAASEAAALVGFLGVVLTGAPALYGLGLLFTMAGLAVSGPLRANLIRDQEALALRGCPIALVPALRHAVTDRTR